MKREKKTLIGVDISNVEKIVLILELQRKKKI